MAKVRVKIIEKDGEFFVDPAIAVVSFNAVAAQNDKLKLFNTTSEDLVFRIESNNPFGGAGNTQLEVVPAGKSIVRTVDAGATDGQYPYQILMIKSGKKAKGNSDPSIIVDN